MSYFDRLMLEFYRVLNNAWQDSVRDAAYLAIMMLAEMPQPDRLNERIVRKWMEVIELRLGPDFAAAVSQDTKAYMQQSFRLGLQDVNRMGVKVSIGVFGYETEQTLARYHYNFVAWIEGVGIDKSQDIYAVAMKSMKEGWTKEKLASELEEEFGHLASQSSYYWLGMAENTLLRIREYGRIMGYKKAGAQYYRLINPMDVRTSEICRALVGANKIYKLQNALDVMEKLNDIDVRKIGLEEARARMKQIAPWINEKQIVYDDFGKPIDIEGNHTPIPPFHWRCRTQTVIVWPDELPEDFKP